MKSLLEHEHFIFIVIAAFGAIAQEFLHWYNLSRKLEPKEFSKLYKSRFKWPISIGVVLISAIGSWILFHDKFDGDFTYQFLSGAAFPSLFKKLSEAFITRTQLGVIDDFNTTVKSYLK